MHDPIRSLAAALVVTGAAATLPAPTTLERPPAGVTGGFDEPSCVTCHIGNEPNAFGGSVRVEGLPDRYEAGAEYALTVVLEAEETTVAGFELAVRYLEGAGRGRSAGLLERLDHRVSTTDSAGVTYAHHTAEGSRPPSPDGASWTVVWTAPDGSAPVAVHVAANSGNGDNSPLSDLVYTAVEQVAPPTR